MLPLMIAAAAAGAIPGHGQDSPPAPPGGEAPVRIWTPEQTLNRQPSAAPAEGATTPSTPQLPVPPAGSGPAVPIDPATGERLAVPGRGVPVPPAGPPQAPSIQSLPSMPAMVPADLLPPAGMAPGSIPPGMLPPAPPPPGTALPPGALPPGALPPGALPPGMVPPRPPAAEAIPSPLLEGPGSPPEQAGPPGDVPAPGTSPSPAGGLNAWMFLVPLVVLAGGVGLFLVERRRRLRRGPTAVPTDQDGGSGRP